MAGVGFGVVVSSLRFRGLRFFFLLLGVVVPLLIVAAVLLWAVNRTEFVAFGRLLFVAKEDELLFALVLISKVVSKLLKFNSLKFALS